jgi:hypothetical protein
LNHFEVLESKTFICLLSSIKIEKRRFLVFSLDLESKFGTTIQCHRGTAVAYASRIIIRSDFEYGLLLPIPITDSYMLNGVDEETPASQNTWVVTGGVIG